MRRSFQKWMRTLEPAERAPVRMMKQWRGRREGGRERKEWKEEEGEREVVEYEGEGQGRSGV